MELDDLMPAWNRLEQQLRSQQHMTAALVAERTSTGVERALQPLFTWQVAQIIAGIALAGAGAQFWIPRMDQSLLFVSGLIVHAYGVALIVNGIRVVLRLKQIDFSAPVIELQKRVAKLDQSYVISGWILGLPWWLLWVPMSVVAMTWAGVDVAQTVPARWFQTNLIIGVLGMALTVAAFHWARRSERPGVRESLARMVSGASLDRAKRQLATVERFEQP